MYSPKLFIVFAAILFGIQTVYGRRSCYRCVSIGNGTCGEKFNENKDDHKVECEADVLSTCFKMNITDNGATVIKRGCGVANFCDIESSYFACTTCDSDYCNSSLNILPSFLTVTAGIGMVLIKFILKL